MPKEYKKSEHHVRPTSRCPHSKKTVILPNKFHSAFHAVFGNLYEQECIIFLQEINALMEEQEEITNKDLARIREEIKAMQIYEFRKNPDDKMYRRRKK